MSRQALEIITVFRGTVLDVRHLAPGEGFTIGPGAADLITAHPAFAQLESHAIASHDAQGGGRLDVVPGLKTAVLADGQIHPIERAGGVRLVPGQRARVDLGDVTLICAMVQAAPIIRNARFKLLDRNQRRYLGAAAVLHAMVLAVAFTVPVQAGSLSMDGFDKHERWVEVLMVPEQQTPEDIFDLPQDEPSGGSTDEAIANNGASSPTPTPEPEAGPTGDTKEEKALRKQIARDTANQVTSAVGDALAEVNAGLGAEAHTALNDMFGGNNGQVAAMGGGLDIFGALDGAGVAPGPGGGPGTSIGVKYGTRTGKGPGDYGDPGPRKMTRRTRSPDPIPGKPIVSEGLSREAVQRVIRRHRNAIRYCYEKALQRTPDLEGKVRVRFLIGPDGDVLGATVRDSTVSDAKVGQCIASRVSRMEFPPIKGGGTVAVTYPFLFRSGS